MTTPPTPPGSYQVNPTELYFDPSLAQACAQGTVQQPTAAVATPQPPQIISPVSAGGTVVVSAMTPHPVMAVHAAPPGVVNGMTVMNGGGILSPGHAPNKSNGSGVQTHHGLHTHTQPLLQSPPPGHARLQSLSMSPRGGGGAGGLMQAVGGSHHAQSHQQYIYASSATAMNTNPHFVYKFHQVSPSVGVGQGIPRPHTTY